MYYGFYSNGTVSDGSDVVYSIPMAYLITLLCCYVFTFLLLSIKLVHMLFFMIFLIFIMKLLFRTDNALQVNIRVTLLIQY